MIHLRGAAGYRLRAFVGKAGVALPVFALKGLRQLRLAQALDKSSHRAGRLLFCRSLDQLNDSAADNRRICEFRNLSYVVRIRDAEPDGYRQPGPSPNALDQRRGIRSYIPLLAGHSCA